MNSDPAHNPAAAIAAQPQVRYAPGNMMQRKKKSPVQPIKTAIWVFFYLLIFEGALRKWFLPFLSTPLLLVRDPVVIWALYKANQQGLLPRNGYIRTSVVIGIITMITAVIFGHGNLLVALFGARCWLFYVPFIFLIGKVFTRQDVIKLGKAMLWIAIPMTILMAMQFYSPQSAWVNRGVGGDEAGAGFSGALGFSRPPGTFSFTNGLALFYGFLSCFIFYFWLNPQSVNRLLLLASTAGLIASIPFSISRGLLFEVAAVGGFVVLATARKPKYLGRIIVAIIGLVILVTLLSKVSVLQPAIAAFSKRFEVAGDQEGGLEGTLGDRYLGGIIYSFLSIGNKPSLFGVGTGMYTNVGTRLLSGRVISGTGEGEIMRMVTETGPLLGLIAVFIRFGISINSFRLSYRKLTFDDLFPWILLSFSLLSGPQANWAQPTSLGFSILSIGVVYAALNVPRKKGVIKRSS